MKAWVGIVSLLIWCCCSGVRAEDFDELNAILKDAVIYIGDTSVAEGLILNLSIKNLRCTNFAVGDMSIVSAQRDSRNLQINVDLVDLNMDCLFEYDYRTLFFGGSGRASIESIGNDASTVIVLGSPDFSQSPPNAVTLESCAAGVNLSNLQFLDGGILALAPVESLLARVVERQAERLICNQFSDLSLIRVAEILGSVRNTLDNYPPNIAINPLSSEQALQVPDGLKLLNMQYRETEVGRLFQFALEEAVAFLSTPALNDDGIVDLKANILLRDFVLEDRALVLNVSDFAMFSDGVLWENEDKLTNTKLVLNSVRLLGLDTFTRFQPLEPIGNYTVQNELSWEYLTFELDATIDIKPSRAEDSVIVDPGSANVVERITVNFGVDNLDAVASFLLAVDQAMLESIQLGSLMQSKDLLSCFLSTIVQLDIPALSVTLTNVQEPTLQGFVSPGLDRVASQAALAAFRTYEASLLKAAPAFFQIAVRDVLNKKIGEIIEEQVSLGGCPAVNVQSAPTDFIDFRDLLLKPQAAVEAGGTGIEPYGDVAAVFSSQMNDRFILSDASGLPKINAAIRPATEAQSGVVGEFRINDRYSLFEYNVSGFESVVSQVKIESSSIAVSHLDTVVQPLNLISAAGAHNLTNSVNMGPVPDRALSISTELLFFVDGDSPLAVDNLFVLTTSLQNAITFDILATAMERNVFEFPLKDVLDVHCWLAALPAPQIDVAGNVMERTKLLPDSGGLQLSRFFLDIEELDFDIQCVSCSSAGGEALPEILGSLRKSGATQVIQELFQNFLNEAAVNYWDSLELHQHISESRKLCPHSPFYDASMVSSFEWPGLPVLSREATESMVVFAMLATNFGIILTAKDHLLRPSEPTEPLSGQLALEPPQEGKLIDWSDLGGSLGDWAFSALEEARTYVGDAREDLTTGELDLGGNILIRELLDENGAFELDMDEFSVFSGGRIEATISRIRVFGLDSMLEAYVLDVLGAQTLSNRLRFETLRLELEITFKEEETGVVESATVYFDLNNVDVNLSILLAIEWQRLGDMKVGSVLHLKKIIPCMVSKFHAVSVTQLLMSAESIDGPQIVGFLSDGAAATLSEASRLFLSDFTGDILSALPKISDITIREVFNQILRDFLSQEETYCSYSSEVSSGGTIDFRDLFLSEDVARSFGGSGMSQYGDTFRILYQTLQEQLSVVDDMNQTALNEMFIRPITYEQSQVNGSLLFPGEVFNMSGTARLSNWEVAMEGKVSDARIENLDSVGEFLKLIRPVAGQASVLNNSMSLGAGPEPLRLSARVYLALSDGVEMNLQNEIDVLLEIDTLTLVISVFLAMSEASFFALPLNQLQDPNCWLSTISPESFDKNINVSSWFQYGLSAKRTNLNVSCVECGSPQFGALIEQLYSPGETQEEADQFVSEAKELIDQFLGSDFLQNLARSVVSDASKACPVGEEYDADASLGEFWLQPETYISEAAKRDTRMVMFNIANAIVAVLFVLGALLARWFVRRKNDKWLESLSEDHVDLVRRQDECELRKAEFLDLNTESMFRSEHIPQRIRYAVPVVLLLNIVLYLVAHIAVLSYINIEANIAGENFTVERFMEFSFFEAAIRTFKNGGKEMSVFLIICSGIWPYVKLLGAMVIWFVPPHQLSVTRRGKIFLWMDALTKLSIVDVVTMLLGIAALLVYIGGPGEEFYNSGELYAMTLVVVPQSGFYCILIAQRMNRVSSRFFLDYHDKIIHVAKEEFKNRHDRKLSTKGTVFVSRLTFDTAMDSKTSLAAPKNNSISSDDDSTMNALESPSRLRSKRLEQDMDNEESSYSSFERPPEMLSRCEEISVGAEESTNNPVKGKMSFEESTKASWDPSRMYANNNKREERPEFRKEFPDRNVSRSTNISLDQSRMYANPVSSFEGSTYLPSEIQPEASSPGVEGSLSFEESTHLSWDPSRSGTNTRDRMLSFDDSTIDGWENPSRIRQGRQETSDFLFYDQIDSFTEANPPRKEETLAQRAQPPSSWSMATRTLAERLRCFKRREGRRHMLGGSIAVVFAGAFVLILFIVGAIMAPSMSMDAKEVLSVMLESGRTYKDAVKDFNVFRVVSLVLLETRFVLSSTADYVGLGILLSLAGLSVVLFPAMQGWKLIRELHNARKQHGLLSIFSCSKTTQKRKSKRKSIIPGFTNRLKVWNHMEVFVISFCVANWQLGAVVSYFLHNYCDLLNRFYEALSYVGIVERTNANCFRAQASDPFTLLIIIGSFFILLMSFVLQIRGQYKKNKEHIEELLEEDE